MRDLRDRVAVITGAAGGIGRALSERLALAGCHIALVDINEPNLLAAAGQIESTGRRVSVHVADVANRSAMQQLPEDVLRHHPGVHLLVNNAGVAMAAPLEHSALEDWEWIAGVNYWGTVYGCKFFLPYLKLQPEAHIVNMASLFGLVGCPGKAAYCSTKFAIRGFTEVLRAELHGSGIGVTCVYPGAVATPFARNGRAWDHAKRELEAEFLEKRGVPVDRVAQRILRGIERNAARVRIGSDAYAADWLTRIFPNSLSSLAGRAVRRIPFL